MYAEILAESQSAGQYRVPDGYNGNTAIVDVRFYRGKALAFTEHDYYLVSTRTFSHVEELSYYLARRWEEFRNFVRQ